jgi:hypothetical protein
LRSSNHPTFSSLLNTALSEAYHGHPGASFRLLPEAALEDPQYELDREAMLILTAERIGLDLTMIFVQGARTTAAPNMPAVIFPYIPRSLQHIVAHAEVLLAFRASKESLICNWTRLGQTVVYVAVKGSHTGIIEALTTAGVQIDARGGNNRTALHRATRREDVTMMVSLLNYGHQMGIKTLDQETSWSANTHHQNATVLNTLLAYGPDPNTKNQTRIQNPPH